ncbi:MAG TPA: glyoxalase [Actinopolymorphaceae bacterium]
MTAIRSVTLEVDDITTADRFYAAWGLDKYVRLRASDAPSSGFRGFTLSVTMPQPSDVDMLVQAGIDAEATLLKPATKSFWGYGGALQAPDGTVWTVASSAKKDTGPATGKIESFVLLLGVADVKASKRFYVDKGLAVKRSFGGKYAEFDLPDSPVTLALNPRKLAAKNAGVPVEGSGSHRLVINGDVGPFTDPDGFVWEATAEEGSA